MTARSALTRAGLADLLEMLQEEPPEKAAENLDAVFGHPGYDIVLAALKGSLDAAVTIAERDLRPVHQIMTIKLDAQYTAGVTSWTATIGWPNGKAEGWSTNPAYALILAHLRALTSRR